MRRLLAGMGLILVLLLSLPALSSCVNAERVVLHKVIRFNELDAGSKVTIKDKAMIASFERAVENAEEFPGIVNVIDPHYQFELGSKLWYLWLFVEEDEQGYIMSLEQTSGLHMLTGPSVRELLDIVGKQYTSGK